MLRIDFWNILWTVVNLLVLYLLMKKFLFGPILKVMDQRKALIDGQFASAGEVERKALELKQKYEESLNNAREESLRIMDQAKLDGHAEYERIVEEANQQAGQIIAGAQTAVTEEKQKALKEMEADIASLAIDAAEQILTERTRLEDDRWIYNAFIAKAGGANGRKGKE